MLRRERKHSYESKIGGTKFLVESESPEDCMVDMLDSLVNLVKRDIENLSGISQKNEAKVIEFPKTVSSDTKTR